MTKTSRSPTKKSKPRKRILKQNVYDALIENLLCAGPLRPNSPILEYEYEDLSIFNNPLQKFYDTLVYR